MCRAYIYLLLVVALAPRVHAHIDDEAKQVYVTVLIKDDTVEVITAIPARFAFPHLLDGASPIELDQLEPEQMAQQIGPILALRNPVRIDDVLVRPRIAGTLTDMIQSRLPPRAFTEAQVMQYGELRYVAIYELKNKPRRISITWDTFAPEYNDAGEPMHNDEPAPVPVVIRAGNKKQLAVLTVDEPEHVWHSDASATIPLGRYATGKAAPPPVRIPVLSLGVVLGSFALGVMVYRRSRPAGAATSLAGLTLALFCLPIGTVHVQPASAFKPLAQDKALDLFRSLHANIYRAFDYTNESEIYDAIAQSVDGPMLESIYNDVYQSLIMREEGGAVSKVIRVDLLHAEIVSEARVGHEKRLIKPSEPGAFMVDVRWRVDGMVQHHGHTHRRLNQFEAVYIVAPRQAGWRIVQAEILDQQRIE